MLLRIGLAAAFTVLALLAASPLRAAGSAPVDEPPAAAPAAKPEGLKALDGEWIFMEDLTKGRSLEELSPPMSSKFWLRVDEGGGAVYLTGHGSGHKDVRIALDGTTTEVAEPKGVVRYKGSWEEGTFEYEVEFDREPGVSGIGMIRRSFKMTDDGLVVRVTVDPPAKQRVGLYRHAADIPMPTPAKAAIADLEWLAGAWVGKRSSGSTIEERWSPARGGAMLAIARTVNASGKMNAFEYLRIVERDGGLVYVAQPGGAAKTEFVLTEMTPGEGGAKRAVFANPRHDYPNRIVYELSSDGKLTATTGQMKGGTPRKMEFVREGEGGGK